MAKQIGQLWMDGDVQVGRQMFKLWGPEIFINIIKENQNTVKMEKFHVYQSRTVNLPSIHRSPQIDLEVPQNLNELSQSVALYKWATY